MWSYLRVAVALGATLGAATSRSSTPGDDPGVQAFLQAYGQLVDSVEYRADDVVFVIGGHHIHFDGGRMVEEGRANSHEACDPIFYPYSLEPLVVPLPSEDMPTYCNDLLESLWGRTESQIRKHGRATTFLGHRMFLNELVLAPLAAVEQDVRSAARTDPSVASWADHISITYSWVDREIAGSTTRSYHAWGMAVDLVPTSYGGRHVYWRWSEAIDEEGWDRIPIGERWSPPEPVIEIFERHGFVWGGKWPHFDDIHFEYRPEILVYNRLAFGGSARRAGS
jgi:D-alanyl-D-alanine carboxypeptidase